MAIICKLSNQCMTKSVPNLLLPIKQGQQLCLRTEPSYIVATKNIRVSRQIYVYHGFMKIIWCYFNKIIIPTFKSENYVVSMYVEKEKWRIRERGKERERELEREWER